MTSVTQGEITEDRIITADVNYETDFVKLAYPL